MRIQRELDITTLFVTHSRQEALSIADRVAIMRAGRIVQYGRPEDLYQRPKNRFVAAFVGEANFIEGELRPAGAGRAATSRAGARKAAAGGAGTAAAGAAPMRFSAAGGFTVDVDTTREAGPAILMFRPEHIEFGESPDGARLRVRVLSREYFGHYYGYVVEAAHSADRRRLRVFAGRRVEVGEDVTVTLPAAAGWILPGEEAILPGEEAGGSGV